MIIISFMQVLISLGVDHDIIWKLSEVHLVAGILMFFQTLPNCINFELT